MAGIKKSLPKRAPRAGNKGLSATKRELEELNRVAGSTVEWRGATLLERVWGSGDLTHRPIIMYWYSRYMTLMVDYGLDAGLTGKLPAGVTDHAIG
ncbi:MAG: hypothetical protein DMG49_12410 [Acidobacteria bacterium]|nr:MAG: hypothetical protein DMG49_12410 [Acidobacteriota bacterium]